MKASQSQSCHMICRYDSAELLDAHANPCATQGRFSGPALGPGLDVSLAISARKTRCIIKRTRNGARVKLVHFLEVYQPVEQDKVVDQVTTERRYRSAGPAFTFDFCDLNVRKMLRSRSVVRSLDKMLSLSLSNGLASGNHRRDRAANGAQDHADRARERGDSGRIHDEKQTMAKEGVIAILARSPFSFFSKLLRGGRA
ncbi:hypothetical protein KTE49_11880 [Burkholderia multivorans]|uniref:hypothetical protein n=1 Tax=Burkholderia cepacia complex TaxID=87882 RepID=UPI0011B29C67|nr:MULTISPECIES: hypothetical protein [Burkholderia cepacia complex]MBJ9616280.1 hypothetical protein [Burkholderia multivorans]MBU9330141.1 hypothetical protein [Burkholderia multivorans]MBU9395255.1 hypothetical protein [Burkholderia multivorans]MBU9531131.1 hypothetical protein [Burkholderia multivorans]MBU9617635.1 hypothetical protein [Burkholderia multivorans]